MKHFLFLLMMGSACLIPAKPNGQTDKDALAAKLQNPLANIKALPIQHNIGTGIPGVDGTSYTMSLQPLYTMQFKNFNMVHRGVVGLSYLPGDGNNISSTFGNTDLNYSFYVTPKKAGKVAWGIGPSIDLPVASDARLGTEKWNLGGSFVMVYTNKKWIVDIVLRQTASIAGNSDRNDVNAFVGQTLIAYGLGKGWVVNTYPTITANWNADKGQQWTVPVGGGINKLVFLGGKLPLNLGAQYYHNAVRPDYSAKGEFRLVTTFVFSK
ncbi:hypothetical protein [Saccharicrinis aurantiacus]|uniref:hypothetical protein n=1 Tax=Saccharicrinis aurantiacus TaxID=1849719 RepID=UPI00094FD76A|nr:hypothetical protein [Saccharicrinis aurantiacus]